MLHNPPRSTLYDYVAKLHQSENFKHGQPHSPELHDKSAVCIKGISFADGRELLMAAICQDGDFFGTLTTKLCDVWIERAYRCNSKELV